MFPVSPVPSTLWLPRTPALYAKDLAAVLLACQKGITVQKACKQVNKAFEELRIEQERIATERDAATAKLLKRREKEIAPIQAKIDRLLRTMPNTRAEDVPGYAKLRNKREDICAKYSKLLEQV